MAIEPGTTLGRFQILGELGQGGMASVYKAFQPALERVVALKVLRPAYANDPEFLERFRREALAIARLRHPHIVQVHDFDDVGGLVFLVMEHIEGGTLKQKLRESPGGAIAPIAPGANPTLDPTATRYAVGGRVTSAVNSEGLAGVSVSAYHRDVCCPLLARTTTDGSGSFSASLPNGSYRFQFELAPATGYATAFYGSPAGSPFGSAKVVVVSGGTVSGVDVQLASGFLVAVHVKSSAGSPIGANVTVNALSGFVDRHIVSPQPDTQAFSDFGARLPNGAYELYVWPRQEPCCPSQPSLILPFSVVGGDAVLNVTMPP